MIRGYLEWQQEFTLLTVARNVLSQVVIRADR